MRYPHTPGPWKCESGMVYTEAGIPIARMDREPGNGTQPVERDSNAVLIAAAPELLDALKECFTDPGATSRRHRKVEMMEKRLEYINKIVANAIEKATH